MDISLNDLKSKEIINLSDGSKMGRIFDLVFDSESGKVVGFVVPGEKHFFKKSEDLFIPIEKVRRIGDDVILVRFETLNFNRNRFGVFDGESGKSFGKIYFQNAKDKNGSFIRYRKLDNKKYK